VTHATPFLLRITRLLVGRRASGFVLVAKGLPTTERISSGPSGGRTWWAHLEFTPINITPTILRKKIEEMLKVLNRGAFRATTDGSAKSARCDVAVTVRSCHHDSGRL